MSPRPPLPIVGEAVQIKERDEVERFSQQKVYVLTFRLRGAKDASGNSLPPTSVEMRGGRFNGALNEGEEVRVYGKWRKGILASDRGFNQTTQSWFEVSTNNLPKILSITIGVLFVAVVIFGILRILMFG